MVKANIDQDESDIYSKSNLIHKLRVAKKQGKKLHIAFLDIDATMTGSVSSTNSTRKQLEELGYTIVYVTSRTEEMLMSEKAYLSSVNKGFDRPRPLLGKFSGKYTYLPPEQTEPEGLLDPDIIAGSTGSQILIKQKTGGYLKDKSYEESFCGPTDVWRKEALALVDYINGNDPFITLAPYEFPENYHTGITNIYPPLFRVVLYFDSWKEKKTFIKMFRLLREANNIDSLPFNPNTMHLTDDSHPRKKLYTICLTPRYGYKTTAVEHIVKMVTKTLGIERSDLHLLIAGDSFPDMDMGLRGGRGTHATFVIAGGSRLIKAFNDTTIGDPTIEETLEVSKNFESHTQHGYYHYMSKDQDIRRVIIADEICQDKKEVDSLLTLLKSIT